VFERFTTQGRAAVAMAVEEARSFGHAAIGTEHLLLALIRAPETEAAQALFSLGVELSATRSVVRRILGWGEPSEGEMPFTPEA
jgi:ATP-dependent Clp protease ATP-binding subunit ClpC